MKNIVGGHFQETVGVEMYFRSLKTALAFEGQYFPGPVRIMAPKPHEINSHNIAEVLSASPNSSSVYVEGHG